MDKEDSRLTRVISAPRCEQDDFMRGGSDKTMECDKTLEEGDIIVLTVNGIAAKVVNPLGDEGYEMTPIKEWLAGK